MYKRLLSLLLCVLILAAIPFAAFADGEESEETLAIRSVKDFLAFAEACRLDSYSQNLNVSLEADLDLGGCDFQGIPIFAGSFDGKGHCISGLSITVESSAVGLFRYLTDTAYVKNLRVQGLIAPGGSRSLVGGIAGENSGSIVDCVFNGEISGGDKVGGIAGANLLSGVVEGCTVSGSISGKHFVGGITGENSGVVRRCENFAPVNIHSQQNEVDIDDVNVQTLISSESAATVTDMGGVAGINSGLIRSCTNYADVGYRHMGYNIGGIAGTQMGYITHCDNYGSISGRKEAGGIAGQIEPVSALEFTADTLQILQGQLDTLEGLTNKASANAQGGMAAVGGELSTLGGHVSDAMDAVGTLIPNEEQGGEPVPDMPELPGDLELPDIPGMEDSYLPDQDTITAAQNSLSSSMSGMQSSMNRLMSGMQGTINTLSSDMRAITNQIGLMSETMGSVGETMGGSISDVSDLDTDEILTGKTENCRNFGSVLADTNAGGIVGAVALGNDLDHEDDLKIQGENSLNFESELRAVILRCENSGSVSVGKQNAGGIAGLMHFGLVRLCVNTGGLDNSGADYIGGIAGESRGYIRLCSAKCEISGDDYVGGIAGSAAVATDCRAMTVLAASERYGGILGWQDENSDEETPVSGNFYLPLEADPGAIDRISYEGRAKALSREEFLALEALPELFKTVRLSFLLEDGSLRTVELLPGEALSLSQVPEVPEKAGYLGHWAGLEEMTVPFDRSFTLSYTPLASTVESAQRRPDGRPVMLMSGALSLGAEISAESSGEAAGLVGNRTVLDELSISISGAEGKVTLRYLPPEGTDLRYLILKLRGESVMSREVEYSIEGSYLVFEADSDVRELSIARNNGALLFHVCAAAALLSLLILLSLAAVKIKRRKKQKANK